MSHALVSRKLLPNEPPGGQGVHTTCSTDHEGRAYVLSVSTDHEWSSDVLRKSW